MSWETIVEQVNTHGKVHWPGPLVQWGSVSEGTDQVGHGDFWVQRVGWLDITRSNELCMTLPHGDDERVPFVGEALLRAVYETDSQKAMADLMSLLWYAMRDFRRSAV